MLEDLVMDMRLRKSTHIANCVHDYFNLFEKRHRRLPSSSITRLDPKANSRVFLTGKNVGS